MTSKTRRRGRTGHHSNNVVDVILRALDYTNDAIILGTMDGTLLYHNKAYLDIHAMDPNLNLAGRNIQNIERLELLPIVKKAMAALRTRGFCTYQFGTVRWDGKYHDISVAANVIPGIDPPIVVAVLREVTDLVQSQKDLERRNRELGVINQMHAAMTSTGPRRTVIRNMLRLLGDYIGATYYAVYRVDSQRKRAVMIASIGLPLRYRNLVSEFEIDHPAVLRTFKSGATCVLEQDSPRLPGRLDHLRVELGVKRTIIFVSRARGVSKFITIFGLTQGREITDEERGFYETAAHDFGMAIERVELLEELDRRRRDLERRNEELALIGEIYRIITTEPTRKKLVRRMLITLRDFIGAKVAGLFEIDRSKDRVAIVDAVGVPPGIRRRIVRIPMSNPSFAWMVHQRGVVVVEQDIPDHIGDMPEIREALGVKRTIACVFETGTGHDYQIVFGLEKDEDVKPEVRRFLESSAQRFGLGIERRELLENLRKSQVELKALTMRLIDSGEQEKRRLARILHDDVGQLITGLRYEVDSLEKTLVPSSARKRKLLEAMRRHLALVTDSTRTLSRSLHPSMLAELGLVPALAWYVDNFVRSARLKVDMQHVGFDRRLPPDIEVALYRVAQECLTNVVRHANASHVTIKLTKGYPRVIMSIEDNGKGISIKKGKLPAQGLGLVSMRERVQYLGGTFECTSVPGKGTKIRAQIPIGKSRGGKD
jgi:PAS domain S-box-containing protein